MAKFIISDEIVKYGFSDNTFVLVGTSATSYINEDGTSARINDLNSLNATLHTADWPEGDDESTFVGGKYLLEDGEFALNPAYIAPEIE